MSQYDSQVVATANKYGIPPALALAVMQKESSGNPNAVSSAGAQGLFQLMPSTGASLGVTNPFDPSQNIDAGERYLSQLYTQYGDWNTALVAYNEGPGNLANKGVFSSSADYASSILAAAGIDSSNSSDTASLSVSSLFPSLQDVTDASGGLSVTAWAAIGAGLLAVLLLLQD